MLSAEDLIGALQDCFAKDVEIRFRHFVSNTNATYWLIAADFVLTGHERRNDAFGFSVIPYDTGWDAILGDLRAAGVKDLKQVRSISPSMLSYLKADRRFHFCFLANQDRHELSARFDVQRAIDRALQTMERWEDVERHSSTIRAFRKLRQEAAAGNFNYRLFNDILLTALVAAWLSYLLVKHARADLILWLPDRDKMTSAYGGIIHEMFVVNFSGLCQRCGFDQHLTSLAIAHEPDQKAKHTWYDDFVRVPDHIVGAMARWDLKANSVTANHPKHVEILEEVIADNSTAATIKLHFSVFDVRAAQLVVSKSTGPLEGRHPYTPPWAILDFVVAEQVEPLKRAKRRNLHALLSSTACTTFAYLLRPGHARRPGHEVRWEG